MPEPMPEYDNLPESMRQARRWLLWKSVPVEGKKPRKVPFYTNGKPRNGALDTPHDTAQLVSFEEAAAALTPQYSGLGFALGPDGRGHWQGVDLDSLSEHPELQAIASELPGYTELSPSGNGLHAIGFGRPFAALGSNGSGIEAYSAGRYFTVTAEGSGLGEPIDLADWINAHLRAVHARRPAPTAAAVTEFVPARTIAELRSALLSMRADDRSDWVANGQRLKKLGEQGRALWLDWSATSDKFDPADAARVWDSLSGDNTGYQAVFAQAQARGWVNPLSNDAGTPAVAAAPTIPQFRLDGFTEEELEAAALQHPHAFMGDDESGLFPVGEVTVIGAPGREGKTTLIMAIARHYALGEPIAGMVPAEIRSVVIYSAEDDRTQYARKTAAQAEILPTADRKRFRENVRVPDLYTPEVEHWRDIVTMEGRVPRQGPAVDGLIEAIEHAKATDCPPGLVIFETASTLSAAEEDNPGHRTMIAALKRIAKRTDVACVLVHHTSQNAATHLPEINISEADIRGGTTLVANARQTHLIVNLGSTEEPFPEADARTVLRQLVAPGAAERVVAMVCLSSSKCADPVPLFFRWEISKRFGPRMALLMPPIDVRGKRWRRLHRMLAGAKAAAKADKKAETGQANIRMVVRAAAELCERGEAPTITKLSAACGFASPRWAKPYAEAAVELGELVRTTEKLPRAPGMTDVFRVPEGVKKPWIADCGAESDQ